ncbi:MAG: hypothetical protein LH606_05145 [Cytophagaceae bacterium]|nr:hypothetical protein [Cytophagaceae bacterium]
MSFQFGIIAAETPTRFKQAGALVIGTSTPVLEAKTWEVIGSDIISTQGAQAGYAKEHALLLLFYQAFTNYLPIQDLDFN